MNTRLAICLAIVIAILFAPAANASSGALRRATIKQCPNGIYYGIHGGDNHWHQAEQSNVSSGWSAIGDAFYYDPCPPDEVVYAPIKEESTLAPAPTPTPEPESASEPAPEASPESDDGYIVDFTAEPLYVDQADSNEPATSAAAQASSDTDSESDKQDEQEDDKKDKEIASLDNEKEEKRNDDSGDSWSSSSNDSGVKKKHGKGSVVAAGLVEAAAVVGGVYVVKKKKK